MSGSGVYRGLLLWRMYCVEWKTRNAKPARKSREESRPATGRSAMSAKYFLRARYTGSVKPGWSASNSEP
ncbi:hypothetical protein E2C01_014027 [Portunus trituberculatus]|uniref:Uncharacterized protein n=1 Tax=Portunus trituberculatus TaxID=210409 RepID=A0A5B7DIT2_PORTR|nr:hypothetical protein [Portunus trituberculatus]